MQSGNKSKTKWCIDPCGNNWSKDDNKIGQRLLEKMGWSKGKGLGKLEDGNPDHIKVSTKNDVKGLGFNGYDDVWLEHQQDFDEVLKSLNQDIKTDESSKKVKSLTERSQSSKTRVHRYKKFIAGKDLSNKSEKDLKCIFGKSCDEPVSTNSDEVFRPNCGSMNDYFAKKMAEKLNKIQNNEVITKTGVEITVNNNEAPISAEENLVKTNEDNQLLNKKEKKKKIKVKEEIRVSNSNDEALPTKEEKKRMKRLRKEEENHEEEKRMKKKLKKESEILINNEEKKRKKKLKKEKREIKELTKSFKHEVSLEDVSLETSVVNRKEKKRKLHVEEVEKNLELPLEKKKKWKENTNNTTESQKKKKKKKRNKSNDEIINDLTEFEIESNEIKQKKTKKIKEKQVLISKSINPFEN